MESSLDCLPSWRGEGGQGPKDLAEEKKSSGGRGPENSTDLELHATHMGHVDNTRPRAR